MQQRSSATAARPSQQGNAQRAMRGNAGARVLLQPCLRRWRRAGEVRRVELIVITSIVDLGPGAAGRRLGWVLSRWRWSRACARPPGGRDREARGLDVSTVADAEGPVAAKPRAGLFVRGRGAHDRPQERLLIVKPARAERVDGLRAPGLSEALQRPRVDLRELDHRPPELPYQPKRDLLLRTLPQQDPATLAHRQLGGVAQYQARRRRGRVLPVQPLPDQLGQDPRRSEQRHQRALSPDLDQIRVHKRTPSRRGIGGYDRLDLIGKVKRREELVNKQNLTPYPPAPARNGRAPSRRVRVTIPRRTRGRWRSPSTRYSSPRPPRATRRRTPPGVR